MYKVVIAMPTVKILAAHQTPLKTKSKATEEKRRKKKAVGN